MNECYEKRLMRSSMDVEAIRINVIVNKSWKLMSIMLCEQFVVITYTLRIRPFVHEFPDSVDITLYLERVETCWVAQLSRWVLDVLTLLMKLKRNNTIAWILTKHSRTRLQWYCRKSESSSGCLLFSRYDNCNTLHCSIHCSEVLLVWQAILKSYSSH